MSNRAWVTLATNDSYGLGALVVAHSLRRVGSSYPAVVLITPSVTAAMRERLRAVFAEVIAVDVLDSQDAAHLALLQRPELGITFTKIHCWNLTQYEKCVFLDADILVVQNCDELFEREELSAAPDVGWPDCFNSGVFVFQPSADTFSRLIAFGQERGSFDGGDQGLLNSYFSNWSQDTNKRLPFLYNVTSAAFYSYLPALKHYGQDLKIIHFIGAAKPWLQQYNFESRSVDAPEHLKGFLQLWWDLFTSQVHTQLDTTMTGVAGNLARVVPGVPLQREALDELTRRQGWETGNIDYMGADSFANIWAKISQTLDQSPKQPSPPKESPPAEAPAKDSVEELAEKVATSVISEPEPANIPVLASEAAQAAGKTTIPSNVDILVPECTPEINPTVKSDISEPKGTVAAEDSVQHVTSCEPSKLDTEPVNEPAIPLEIPSQEKPAEQITVNVLPVLSSNNSESKNGSSTEIKPDSSVESVAVPEKTEIPPTQTHVVSQTEPQLPDQLHETECPIQQSEAKPVLNTSDVSDEQNKSELHEEPKPTPTSTELKEAPKPVATDVHEPKLESESLDTKSGPVSDVAHEKAQVIESAISEVVSETQLVEPKLDTTKTEIVTTISEQDKSPSKTEVPVSASDSPPLANTPSQDEIPIATVAKSLEEAAQETRL
ncbi:glycogenin-2 isoform X2 [Leptidea sinapis]|uniref:glycogenin-2 isoform X2 n=1 Tax=Leptidea sinapis TaxID=189913 RepID=UPI00213A8FBB|nr:glycogenin-2 isoform X2 [Leptidea sinapis]XP_050674285.1 glycogenin-2 isoform X2 [Leptidea sinapis]